MTMVSEIQHYPWKNSCRLITSSGNLHRNSRYGPFVRPLQYSNSLAPSRCGSIAPPPSPPFGVKLRWTALRAKENDAQCKKIGWPVFKSFPSYYCICAACLTFTGWTVRGSNPGVGTRDFLPQKTSTPFLRHTRPHIQWIPGFFSGDKEARKWK